MFGISQKIFIAICVSGLASQACGMQPNADFLHQDYQEYIHNPQAQPTEKLVAVLNEIVRFCRVAEFNLEGITPLHLAVIHRETTSFIEPLIAQGAWINAKTHRTYGCATALHGAIFAGNLEAVRILLKHKARIDIPNNNNFTPCELADDMMQCYNNPAIPAATLEERTQILFELQRYAHQATTTTK